MAECVLGKDEVVGSNPTASTNTYEVIMMKVKDLIEQLQQFDPELIVVKSKDDEGNSFHKLWSVDDRGFILTESLDKFYLEVLDEESVIDEYSDSLSDWQRVVVVV